MKPAKLLCTLILAFNLQTGFGQTLSLTTAKDEHCTYIKPTLYNITKLLFASNEQYISTLEAYNYQKAASGGDYNYMAIADERSHFRLITKSEGILMMTFGPNNVNMVSIFRNDIKGLLDDPVVEHEDGYEVYRVLLPHDGLKFKVLFRLKEKTETITKRSGDILILTTGFIMAIIK